MTRVLTVTLALLLGLALGAATAVYRDLIIHQGRILPRVTIAGEAVGGLSPTEARERLRPIIDLQLAQPFAIRADSLVWQPTLSDLGVRAETEEALTRALALGRERDPARFIRSRLHLRRGIDVPLRFTRDEDAVRRVVAGISRAARSEPVDAAVTLRDGRVVVTRRSHIGWMVEVVPTTRRVVAALDEGLPGILAVRRAIPPRFSSAEARRIVAPVASYTTRFVNIPNRNHNIALAASKLRGTLILAGETFSFNTTVGPRTAREGYLPAPVLINNQLVPGDGGGVCQVSSTLYNVALLAELSVFERTNHSRPVAYLPIGRDATVSYGGLDLRFRNTTGAPLLLWSDVRGLSLTLMLYGAPGDGREVALTAGERTVIPPPEGTVTYQDPTLDEGKTVIDPPKPGYRVTLYRVVMRDGAILRREVVSNSLYRPVPRTLKIGTKKIAATPAAP